MIPKRMVIYTKDVINITGRSESSCQRLLAKVRRHNKKKPRAVITVDELCEHMKLEKEKVMEYLR